MGDVQHHAHTSKPSNRPEDFHENARHDQRIRPVSRRIDCRRGRGRRNHGRQDLQASRSHDRRHSRRHPIRSHHLQGHRRGVCRASSRLQRHLHDAGHRRRRTGSEGQGRSARRCAGDFPDQVGGDHQAVPRLPELRRLPPGLRAHGADDVGPDRVPAVRHGRRHSERQTSECTRNDQHSRRALRDLQGCVRCASFDGPVARRRTRGLREIPAAAGCHRIRGATRCRVRQESRLQETSALLRAHGLQGHLRCQGHALHGRRRREIRRRLCAA